MSRIVKQNRLLTNLTRYQTKKYGLGQANGNDMASDSQINSDYLNVLVNSSPGDVGYPAITPSLSTTNSGISSNSSSSIAGAISTGIAAAANIFNVRYAVPQLNPGQYIAGPGTVAYQLPNSGTITTSNPFTGGLDLSSLGSFLPILLIGGVLIFAMNSKNKN